MSKPGMTESIQIWDLIWMWTKQISAAFHSICILLKRKIQLHLRVCSMFQIHDSKLRLINDVFVVLNIQSKLCTFKKISVKLRPFASKAVFKSKFLCNFFNHIWKRSSFLGSKLLPLNPSSNSNVLKQRLFIFYLKTLIKVDQAAPEAQDPTAHWKLGKVSPRRPYLDQYFTGVSLRLSLAFNSTRSG